MMKAEFEAMAGKSVTDEEYKVIEAVYTWHPAINDTTGKDQMKTLYTQFGFGVIRGMLPVAEKMEKLDGERRELLAQLDTIKIREGLLAVQDVWLLRKDTRNRRKNMYAVKTDRKVLRSNRCVQDRRNGLYMPDNQIIEELRYDIERKM